MPPGPLTARYGTWIMLRMAKPMLTRARAKARKRSSRIITWRPALSSFTRCGKTGETRHSHYFNVRVRPNFHEVQACLPQRLRETGVRARQQAWGFQTVGDFLRWTHGPQIHACQLTNKPLFLRVDTKSKCALAVNLSCIELEALGSDVNWCTQAPVT